MAQPAPPDRPGLGAALLLAGCTVLVLAAFTLHPDESGSTPGAILAAIVRGRAQAHLVHGAMLAAFAAYAAGFGDYAVMLGVQRRWVRSALVVYLLGTALILPAIVLDGFVTPVLAGHILAEPAEALPVGRALMQFAGSVTALLIQAGFSLIAAAMVVWTVVRLRQPGVSRVPAAIALAAAGFAMLLVLGGGPRLAPMLIPALLLLQTIWNLAAAWQMLRARAASDPLALEFAAVAPV